jgi:hypothetical protein
MMLPLLLFMGGRKRVIGLVARGVVPAAVVTVPVVAASVHNAIHALVKQPTFPDLHTGHQTPWTFLAPKLGGKGKGTMVGGGPPRIATLVVATAFGGWAQRWRERPELMAWALAVALSFRIFLETVLYSYYIWPALAVAMAVAARGSLRRFAIAITLAIGATVVGQWHMGWVAWWTIDVVCVAGVLIAASRPQPLEVAKRRATPKRSRPPEAANSRAVSTKAKGALAQSRPPQAAKAQPGSGTAKKKANAPGGRSKRPAPR